MDSVRAKRRAGETKLVLDSILDVSRAQALYRALDQALGQSAPIVMDGSRVERVDTAAVQMLAAFGRATHERGLKLKWQAADAGAVSWAWTTPYAPLWATLGSGMSAAIAVILLAGHGRRQRDAPDPDIADAEPSPEERIEALIPEASAGDLIPQVDEG